MGKNKELGQEGEQLAADYLNSNGWKIVEMNYRFSHSEVDLIAQKEELLVFFEVKTRTSIAFGMPEDFVDEKKVKSVLRAANHYIEETEWKGNIRFDIISIVKNKELELVHIEDAFY